jgi:hypothetical protein
MTFKEIAARETKKLALRFEYMNLWEEDTSSGWFCASKAKYTAEQTEELFQREYRPEMDYLEINGGSAEEYREVAKAMPGYARFTVGRDEDGEPCGGYVFVREKQKDQYGAKKPRRGEFEVWAIRDCTHYDG